MTESKNVNPKSLENLITYKKGDTTDKAKNGRLGGIASGESKRRAKTFKQSILAMLEQEIVNGKGEKITLQESIVGGLILKASKGDVKAFTAIRDTIGEKPVDESKVIVENAGDVKINLDLVKDMEKHFNETDK
jgi:hypothetical protein